MHYFTRFHTGNSRDSRVAQALYLSVIISTNIEYYADAPLGKACYIVFTTVGWHIEEISLISIYHTSDWKVPFAHSDWLAQRWLAKYYSPLSSQRKTKLLSLVYCQNKFTLWSASYSACVVRTKTIIHRSAVKVKVVGTYLAASRLGKYPPLFTCTTVNKLF